MPEFERPERPDTMGGGIGPGGGVDPAPQDPVQPAATPKIQDDPNFRALDRFWQKKIESGALSLEEAMAQAGGGSPATPTPSATAPQVGEQMDESVPEAAVPQSLPDQTSRLSLGRVLGGGRLGQDTFARMGSGEGRRAFAGQEFGGELSQRQIPLRNALRFGNVGRNFTFGSNPGSGQGFMGEIFDERV